ncbi:MAG: M1 family metallopeptidase, partial [Actinomycetota bacterium]|nr:M1 family metallopeptidase [Actinomycetota bacterium]
MPTLAPAHTGNPYRLPRNVVPHRYTLALQPDLAAATFVGHVIIDANVNEPVQQIVLNAAELEISEVKVAGEPAEFELHEATERLTIAAAHDTGTTTIEITFTGVLNDKLRGWYRSTYLDTDGNEQVIATSQMQATDCRRAFPCFDEPDFKAVFDITLIVEPHLLAVSNGPEIERAAFDDGSGTATGKVAVRFAETMPMSTYLVAVVVGPLEATEPVMVPRVADGDGDPIALRIIHVPGKGHLTAFGLDVGAFALGWYQQYYGIPYPTDKCDMLALPDFAAGAMENLGCITYRESLLLADPAAATQFELQNLADVITHELAHMWFGDLVTMKWWNGIWLNEAFATFMEVACCAAYRPDWLRWTSFSLERSMAFEVDSLASTRTVEFPVEAPADCDGMFDVLTYQKGGSLLRMLEQYLGEDAFRDGIRRYLQTHQFGNTETGDLWDALEAETGEPVRTMMDSWIFQGGFPLVSASTVDGVLRLRQEQFRFAAPSGDDGARWQVPVVVNAGGHAFYRVSYDAELEQAVLAGLDRLQPLERYAVLDDAHGLTLCGERRAGDLAHVIQRVADLGETDLAVWQLAASSLELLHGVASADERPSVSAWICRLLAPLDERLGAGVDPEDDDRTRALRGLVLGLRGAHGDPAATARAATVFDHQLRSPG